MWEEIANKEWERQPNANFNKAAVFRSVPIEVKYTTFGWKTKGWLNYVSLVPLTFLTCLGMYFNFRGLMTSAKLPEFDPTDLGSLILASARGDLHHLDSMKPIGTSDEQLMNSTKVRLGVSGRDPSQPWGLVMKQ
ncbi:hypothetical protein T439DRAFT_321522 [Meredithblackwellia eburnea MCA 4105]